MSIRKLLSLYGALVELPGQEVMLPASTVPGHCSANHKNPSYGKWVTITTIQFKMLTSSASQVVVYFLPTVSDDRVPCCRGQFAFSSGHLHFFLDTFVDTVHETCDLLVAPNGKSINSLHIVEAVRSGAECWSKVLFRDTGEDDVTKPFHIQHVLLFGFDECKHLHIYNLW